MPVNILNEGLDFFAMHLLIFSEIIGTHVLSSEELSQPIIMVRMYLCAC